MATYEKDQLLARRQAIIDLGIRTTKSIIPIQSLPKFVPVYELLRNFAQSMLSISAKGHAMEDFGEAAVEHYNELRTIIENGQHESLVTVMNDIVATLLDNRISGDTADGITALLSGTSSSVTRPSAQVTFILKGLVDIMAVFRGRLDRRNAQAIIDSFKQFSRNYSSLMNDLAMQQDSFYGGVALTSAT